MTKLIFAIVTITFITTVYVSQPRDYIGNYFECEGKYALCTPKGWIWIHSKSTLEEIKNSYIDKKIYGKELTK